jgi:hypothetical protein
VDQVTNATRLRTRTFVVAALYVLVLLLGSASVVKAQIYYGTITGTVTDSTGAVVSGAAVTVKSIATGATYPATSSDSGVYVVAQLPVGLYEVRVAQKGFKEFVATSVEVHTSSDTRVDAQLQLGAATETVQVEASDVQVETTSGAVGNVIEGTQVRELPLNGENFMGLVTLTPGVSTANTFDSRDKGLTGGADFSVNGNPYNYNLFLVDGVNNNDVGSGRTILVYPSIDTIAEFKMLTNSYGPEYGQATGSIISITTKSGTNQYHAGLFYAGRNDALDANDWFSNFNNTGKAELRRNDWGYNLSGPIWKNKLWGWWNQEWNREIRGVSVTSCVPTANELAGNFTYGTPGADFTGGTAPTATTQGTLPADYCGATLPAQWVGTGATATLQSLIPASLQMSGNIYGINPANLSKAGVALLKFYPTPNITPHGGDNWALSENQKPDWSEWNVRVDYDLTKKNRATFRWTQDSWTSPGPNPNLFWGDSEFPAINSDWSQPSKSVMAKLSTQVTDTMVNDFEFGYGHNAIITTLNSTGLPLVKAIDAAMPTAWPASFKSGPALPVSGWGGFGPYGSNTTAGGTMWTIAPYANHEDLYALQDNVSKVKGSHLFKVGAYYSTNAKIENNNGGSDYPGFGFGGPINCAASGAPAACAVAGNIGVQTGNSIANGLLPGELFSVGENTQNATARVIWHDFEWYAGDTWKVTRNVTLTYGFRWSFLREPYGENNEWTSWSLADYSPSRPASDACNGIVVVPGTDPCGNALKILQTAGVSLPLSSGTPGPNRALVNNNNHAIAPRLGIAWDPWGNGKTAIRAGVGQFYQREPVGLDEKQAFNAPFVINATEARTLDAVNAAGLSNPSVSPCCSKDPRAVVPNSWQWNISVEREMVRNMTLQLGYVGNAGIHLTSGLDLNAVPRTDWVDASYLNASTGLNALRPAANFGSIYQFGRNGHASYNSFQMLYKWQMSNFSTLQAAYTWSHSIGNVELDNSSGSVNQQGTTDQSNPRLDRGNTNINRPNIFVLNEVYYLPKLTGQGAAVRQTLGGWELNSILTVNSGSSLSVFASQGATDALGGTLQAIQGSGWGTNPPNFRPDRTSVSCNADESGRQILNAGAFTYTGYVIGNVGNVPRGYCYGPDNRNFDMQLAKNWYFKERYRVKFSMDFFNLFNHANFYGNTLEGATFSASHLQCGTTVCSPANDVVTGQAPGQNNGFGQASAVHPGRELQYTLRLYF